MSISADASMRSQFNSLPVQSGYSTTSNTAMIGREYTSNSEPQSSKSANNVEFHVFVCMLWELSSFVNIKQTLSSLLKIKRYTILL